MRNIEMLDLINEGRIDELKRQLQDEIYAESLKNKPGAKQRYSAMKKYFTYIKAGREICAKPCMIDYEGKPHVSFCNSHSLALTMESCGEMKLFEDVDRYPDVTKLIRREGVPDTIDFGSVRADAKSKGYRLKKSEVNGHKFRFLMKYNGTYFKLGLLDATFSIIDDGMPATVFHKEGRRSPITLETSVGVCTVMPMSSTDSDVAEMGDVVVIEVE